MFKSSRMLIKERNYLKLRQFSERFFWKGRCAHAKPINVELGMLFFRPIQNHVRKHAHFPRGHLKIEPRITFRNGCLDWPLCAIVICDVCEVVFWCECNCLRPLNPADQTLNLNGEENTFKFNHSNINGDRFLKTIGCAKHILVRILHRLNLKVTILKWHLWFETMLRKFFLSSTLKWPSMNTFFHWRTWSCRSRRATLCTVCARA